MGKTFREGALFSVSGFRVQVVFVRVMLGFEGVVVVLSFFCLGGGGGGGGPPLLVMFSGAWYLVGSRRQKSGSAWPSIG